MKTELASGIVDLKRIALILSRQTTSTTASGGYGERRVGDAVDMAPVENLLDRGPFPVMETYTAPVLLAPTTLFTTAIAFWDVTEPLAEGSEGIQAATCRFAKAVARIPEVLGVSYSLNGRVHIVWTFIGQRNKDVRRRVYGEELRLMEDFPELTFDFNVVALAGEGRLLPDDLQGWVVFYRSRSEQLADT